METRTRIARISTSTDLLIGSKGEGGGGGGLGEGGAGEEK